jgi:uncharacterized membrane protein
VKRQTAFKLGLLMFIISFIICLGFYNELPQELPTHFNINNEADSFASKNMALFGINAFMVLVYLLCYMITNRDPKRYNQGDKALNVVLIIIPAISILTTSLVISYGLGNRPSIDFWISGVISIMFILIGNYLPKTKRNYTIGIKLPWTLASDYVWEKTHRMAGYLWILGGLLSLISLFIFKNYVSVIFPTIILVIVIVPIIYSYLIYKKCSEKGEN